MHFFQTIYVIWQRELIRYLRDKTRIFSSLLQPLMFLAIFGVGLQSTLSLTDIGFDFIQFMFPGIIAMSVMGVAFFSTISTVWDREFGFLKEILVAPVPRSAIAIGKTFGATTIAALQAVILFLLAPVIGLRLSVSTLPALALIIVLLAFSISGLGLLIASRMRTTESFGLLMQVLVFPMFFLSGAFFPLTSVPFWMSAVAHLNPLSYGVDAMRQVMLSGQVSDVVLAQIAVHSVPADILFLTVFSAVMVLLAVLAFSRRE
ncbi:ABC transporter [Candidatus Uhrbacteria bacterium CG_4_10_14_0_8_um_filter_58_22]|uniref:Transport permease protein n=1 Tax=Candidatus Uhrbacteria bacterium CG_4_10_14_0_8_um_filter_58_22 TaxID=1975029 RepID=A0A2M7QBA1_9BACT|nr:MAG: hypothetical protein AUJ19_01415 [Parcubacteria group bacterium CG1_02_58_44]PIY62661.1 MAG: ABC transporter [Candidatus Uhrbacteria bacterium CG_4_10_14_0_8_um_filter_58_22]